MSMLLSLRQTLHWGGIGLAIIGIVFVIFRMHSYWVGINIENIRPLEWCLIGGTAAIYGANNFFLASAWWHLLGHFGERVGQFEAIRIYGISQLAKYVPGNIFQLAGRQALGMAAGISGVVLVKSAIWELGLIAIAGSLFGWLILPLVANSFHESLSFFLLISSVVFIAVVLARLVGHQMIWAFACQLLFLVISASVFVALLYMMADTVEITVGHCMAIGGAYIIAWLIGLVTPGAPAGIGVRELVLLLLLKGLVNESDLLIAILFGRLITVIGDLLFFVAAGTIPKNLSKKEEIHV